MPAHSFLAISREPRHRLAIACNDEVMGMIENPVKDRFMSRAEVVAVTGLSPTTLWREMRAGRFPAALKLSRGRVGFRETDVIAWMDGRRMTLVSPTAVPLCRSNKSPNALAPPSFWCPISTRGRPTVAQCHAWPAPAHSSPFAGLPGWSSARLAWGSRSMRATFSPARAAATATRTAAVVFPHPPLLPIKVSVRMEFPQWIAAIYKIMDI